MPGVDSYRTFDTRDGYFVIKEIRKGNLAMPGFIGRGFNLNPSQSNNILL